MMVKDNDGRVALKFRIRRVAMGACCICIFILNLHLLPKLQKWEAKAQVMPSLEMKAHVKKQLDISKDIHRILSAEFHLVDLIFSHHSLNDDGDTYQGVLGVFCKLEWSKHKANPSSYPMFRDLLNASPDCGVKTTHDLKEAVRLAKIHDQNTDNSVHVMPPKGFVFHESRCGSTLAANALAVTHPESTRVYSESGPPILALKSCGLHMNGVKSHCSIDKAVSLFRDVVYMMGRTNDSQEKNLFFKIQSIGTKNIDVFQKAFPTTPWVFVYRDPVHVMMSHLAHGYEMANCIRQLSDVPLKKLEHITFLGRDIRSLIPEEKCALHLSLLCESALIGLQAFQSMGIPVSYDDFIVTFVRNVLPNHFNVDVDDTMRERIFNVSKFYSKGGRGDKEKEFKNDSKVKEDKASDRVKAAAQLFLSESYKALEYLRNRTDHSISD